MSREQYRRPAQRRRHGKNSAELKVGSRGFPPMRKVQDLLLIQAGHSMGLFHNLEYLLKSKGNQRSFHGGSEVDKPGMRCLDSDHRRTRLLLISLILHSLQG